MIDGTDDRIASRASAWRTDQRRCIMLESPVLKDDEVAGIKLMFEYRRTDDLAVIGYVTRGIKVSFRAIAKSVNDVDNDELFIVMMGLSHDICEGSEEIHAERTVRLPSLRGHEMEKGLNELLRLRVFREFDTRMLAVPRYVRSIGNSDRVVPFQMQTVIAPPVPDDIPGALAVNRPVTLIMVKCPGVKVRLAKILPELLGQPNGPIATQGVAVRSEVSAHRLNIAGHVTP
jgi:Ni,Fe-hydrogenase III small subunit